MKFHVVRGGSYDLDDSWFLRSANRNWDEQEDRIWNLGFRLILHRVGK